MNSSDPDDQRIATPAPSASSASLSRQSASPRRSLVAAGCVARARWRALRPSSCTGWNRTAARTSSGSSSRSRAFPCGMITSLTLFRCAATAFSFSPPMRQHAAAQRDLAGHRDVAAQRDARERADDRRRDRDAGRRSVLRRRAGGNVHVHVARAIGTRARGRARRARARA